MTFKVKDGLQIGSSVIFDANGNLVSNIGVGTTVAAPAGFAKFIAIGDNDSGIGQQADGKIAIGSNNRTHTTFRADGHIESNCTGGEIDFFIGPQTNAGYLYGNVQEIGFYSSTSGAQIGVSKDAADRHVTIAPGSQSSGNVTILSPVITLIGTNASTGIRTQNSSASGSNTAYTFTDYANENNIPGARIYVTHATDGSSTMRFDTTDTGSRTVDRCVAALTISGAGNLWASQSIFMNNDKAVYMDDSSSAPRQVLKIGSDNYVNIFNAGNAGVRILNQSGSIELYRFNTTGSLAISGSVGAAGQVLTSNGDTFPTWENAGFTMGTPVPTTSGSAIDITGIPSSATYIVVSLFGVSTSTSTAFGIQIGDSGGVETSGYAGNTSDSANNTVGWSTKVELFPAGTVATAATHSATITLTKEDSSSNSWSISVLSAGIGGGTANQFGCGRKNLTAALDRVRLMGGTFDAGEMNIAYA